MTTPDQDQVKPAPDAAVPVPVAMHGPVKVDGSLPITARAAEFGGWATYTLTATQAAQPILPYDENRARALIIVSGTGPVFIGTKAQTQASPVLGGQLASPSTVELKNKQSLWLAPDGAHTATVTVLIERWGEGDAVH